MPLHEDYVYAVMADRMRDARAARLANEAMRRRGRGSIAALVARLMVR
jgi:hypothetical protein